MTKNIKDIRIVFMGTSSFADVILNSLLKKKYNIAGVYTRPDKKSGRGREMQKSSVKKTAEANNLRVCQPEKFNELAISELEKIKPDIIIVAAYGKILSKKVLEIPKFGCLNVHASLLPKYRGPSPIHNALLNGERETGATIMLMDDGIDTGDILSQEKMPIHPSDDNHPSLAIKLAVISASLLENTLAQWISKKIKPEKQDNSKATYCKMIEKDDGHILWTDEAEEIFNKYRAFYTWPKIFSFWENKGINSRINFRKISFSKKSPEKNRRLGEVFKLDDEIVVQTALGMIIIHEIQMEGKGTVNIKDFINGYPDFIGSILK